MVDVVLIILMRCEDINDRFPPSKNDFSVWDFKEGGGGLKLHSYIVILK